MLVFQISSLIFLLLNGYSKIAPTVILDPPDDSLIMNEEIFGPLLPIIIVKLSNLTFILFQAEGISLLIAFFFL